MSGQHAAVPLPREQGGGAPEDDAPDYARRTFQAMGCTMTLTLAVADDTAAEAAFDLGRAEIERSEACLSRFRPTSELVRLNERAGRRVAVSRRLGAVLHTALRAAEITGGRCTPTLLEALEAAGYDRDFDALTGEPEDTAPSDACAGPGRAAPRVVAGAAERRALARGRVSIAARRGLDAWRAVRLTTLADGRPAVRVPAGLRLDLAGVAKGWTADRVAGLLAAYGPCLVDAGGDLAARGTPAGLTGWPVAVADPREPDADLALVMLRDAGIATSGVDHRRWTQHGVPRHHLIDPRTGEPSRTDVLTATVIAASAAAAEAHAKSALLLGVRRGLAALADKRLAGLIVRRDGHVFATPAWSHHAYSS